METQTPSTPTRSRILSHSKRLRSPGRQFLPSPLNRSAKRTQLNFFDSRYEGIEDESSNLSINLFSNPYSTQRKSGKGDQSVYSDRFIPSRTATKLETGFDLLKEDKGLNENDGSPKDKNRKELIGFTNVTGVNINHSNTQQSGGSAQSNTNNSPNSNNPVASYNSLLRSELLGIDFNPNEAYNTSQASQSSKIDGNSGQIGQAPSTPRRQSVSFSLSQSQKTPTKTGRQSHSLFKFKSSQRRSLNFDPSFQSHTLSPLSAFSNPIVAPYSELCHKSKRSRRKINKTPFKILDAPNLQDDFYLNLVDWSSQNVLAVGLDTCVYLWSASTSKVTLLCNVSPLSDQSVANSEETGRNVSVTSVSWALNGTHLAVGTSSGFVQLWDVEKSQKIRTFSGHSGRVGALSWSNSQLASGSRDRTIFRRDTRAGEHYIAKMSGHKQEICGLKWSFDDSQLASGGNDNRLLIWNSHSEKPIAKFTDHVAAVKAIAWSPHQSGLLASGGGTADRCIKFWNTLTHTSLNSIDTGSQVCNLMWAKNVNEVVSTHGYSLNQIIVWKYPSMTKVTTLTGHTFRVLYLAMSPDGQTVVTGAGDETLRFWNLFPGLKNTHGSRLGSSILFPSGSDIR